MNSKKLMEKLNRVLREEDFEDFEDVSADDVDVDVDVDDLEGDVDIEEDPHPLATFLGTVENILTDEDKEEIRAIIQQKVEDISSVGDEEGEEDTFDSDEEVEVDFSTESIKDKLSAIENGE